MRFDCSFYGAVGGNPLIVELNPEFGAARYGNWAENAYDRLLRETGARAMHVGDHAQAVAAFDTLISRRPTDVDALLRLADAYRGAGRTSDAEEALRRARAVRRSRTPCRCRTG